MKIKKQVIASLLIENMMLEATLTALERGTTVKEQLRDCVLNAEYARSAMELGVWKKFNKLLAEKLSS